MDSGHREADSAAAAAALEEELTGLLAFVWVGVP